MTTQFLYKTTMCKSVEHGIQCRYGDKCLFAHSKQELKRKPCAFFANGHCNYTDEECFYEHIRTDSVLSECQTKCSSAHTECNKCDELKEIQAVQVKIPESVPVAHVAPQVLTPAINSWANIVKNKVRTVCVPHPKPVHSTPTVADVHQVMCWADMYEESPEEQQQMIHTANYLMECMYKHFQMTC